MLATAFLHIHTNRFSYSENAHVIRVLEEASKRGTSVAATFLLAFPHSRSAPPPFLQHNRAPPVPFPARHRVCVCVLIVPLLLLQEQFITYPERALSSLFFLLFYIFIYVVVVLDMPVHLCVCRSVSFPPTLLSCIKSICGAVVPHRREGLLLYFLSSFLKGYDIIIIVMTRLI